MRWINLVKYNTFFFNYIKFQNFFKTVLNLLLTATSILEQILIVFR